MARKLLRIQTESSPMRAKVARRAALKKKKNKNLSTIRRNKKIFALLCLTTTSSPSSLLAPHKTSSFFSFFSYQSSRKKRKSRFATGNVKLFFMFVAFRKIIVLPLKKKIKIHHEKNILNSFFHYNFSTTMIVKMCEKTE